MQKLFRPFCSPIDLGHLQREQLGHTIQYNNKIDYVSVRNDFVTARALQLAAYSRVGRTLVSAGELSLSYARLLAGRMITLWVRRPLSASQHGQLRGR